METVQGSLAPRIRGVGSDLPNVENSVAMYLDGVYIASPSAALLSLNNIAQIETLKGPQGTLFGRNATGGALLIQTREPTQNLSGDFDVSYGNFQTTTVNGYVADGLNSAVAADLAVHATHQGEALWQECVHRLRGLSRELGPRPTLQVGFQAHRRRHDLISSLILSAAMAARRRWIMFPAGTYPSGSVPRPCPHCTAPASL